MIKKIPDFDYFVDDAGHILTDIGGVLHKLRPRKNNSGYYRVLLRRDGKNNERSVHRLVAEVFVPNPHGLATVNHKDLDKSNNCAENLEWLNSGDNTRHYWSSVKSI